MSGASRYFQKLFSYIVTTGFSGRGSLIVPFHLEVACSAQVFEIYYKVVYLKNCHWLQCQAVSSSIVPMRNLIFFYRLPFYFLHCRGQQPMISLVLLFVILSTLLMPRSQSNAPIWLQVSPRSAIQLQCTAKTFPSFSAINHGWSGVSFIFWEPNTSRHQAILSESY